MFSDSRPLGIPLLLVLFALVLVWASTAAAAPGTDWTARTTPVDTSWVALAYGGGTFVAVANDDVGDHVMTSRDGITWTARSAPAGTWDAVTYGNGLFVAVSAAVTAEGERVITSPDGITWTARSVPNYQWNALTYGDGRFVALATTSSGGRVMTSTDGITWSTSTQSVADRAWWSLTYGNGQFVAVGGGSAGLGARVMTSPDGITWTGRSAGVPNNNWYTVMYGGGQYVALAGNSQNGDQVMTSPDAITWTPRTAAAASKWRSVVYAEGQYVAVGLYETGLPTIMTSPDAITWAAQTAPNNNEWKALVYTDGIFVAVAKTGTGDRVMTSGIMAPAVPSAPTAVAGNRQATVTVAPGTGSGGAASTFLVTSTPGGHTCVITLPATSCTVTGLTNRTAYTFTATATNASGTSAASPASAAITPRGPLVVHTRVTDAAIISTFAAAEAGTATQRAARARLRVRAADISVCSTAQSVTKAGRVTLTCTLTKDAQATRRRGVLRVTLATTLTLADGTTLASTKALVLPRISAPRPVPSKPSAVTG